MADGLTAVLREFEDLQQDVLSGTWGLLDHCGATNPAEFFAVAIETFFECPEQMRQGLEEPFVELNKLYRVDPTEWGTGVGQ